MKPTLQTISSWRSNCQYVKYKQYIVKHNSINDFIKVYFLHRFVQRHVLNSVLILLYSGTNVKMFVCFTRSRRSQTK